MNVLFICHGNVNRSAAAEIITKQNYPQLKVKSCGLKTTNGKITSKKMRDTLNEFGYVTGGIRSTKIDRTLVHWADIIFYMDAANLKRLEIAFGHTPKAHNLGICAGVDRIMDPAFSAGRDQHKRVVALIQTAISNWVRIERPF